MALVVAIFRDIKIKVEYQLIRPVCLDDMTADALR
jgi:hypothetical protein